MTPMDIAGYKVKVVGNLPDSDTVLIEDAVLYLNDKIDQTKLLEIHAVRLGYDLVISYKDKNEIALLRRNSDNDWYISLPGEVDGIVNRMTI